MFIAKHGLHRPRPARGLATSSARVQRVRGFVHYIAALGGLKARLRRWGAQRLAPGFGGLCKVRRNADLPHAEPRHPLGQGRAIQGAQCLGALRDEARAPSACGGAGRAASASVSRAFPRVGYSLVDNSQGSGPNRVVRRIGEPTQPSRRRDIQRLAAGRCPPRESGGQPHALQTLARVPGHWRRASRWRMRAVACSAQVLPSRGGSSAPVHRRAQSL
jgi:hypothetical protein